MIIITKVVLTMKIWGIIYQYLLFNIRNVEKYIKIFDKYPN
jgi:hypothetical protein